MEQSPARTPNTKRSTEQSNETRIGKSWKHETTSSVSKRWEAADDLPVKRTVRRATGLCQSVILGARPVFHETQLSRKPVRRQA